MVGNDPTNGRLALIARKSILMSPTLCFFVNRKFCYKDP